VLVVLDTVRRSSLALHGYERRLTPNLDRWAEGALVFDQATSVSSWTLPAHASMFTGLYPRSHGAHGYRSDLQKESTYRLPDSCDTLAEIAARAGIATIGVVANHLYLDRRFGTDQGFATYFVEPPRPGLRFPPSDRLLEKIDPVASGILDWPYLRDTFVTDAALAALDDVRGRPFFLFVNYLDVHRPNRRAPSAEVPLEDEIVVPRSFPELQRVLCGEPIDERVRRSLVNAYDRELQHLDGELARLLARLAEPDLARETLVIVTSDHGEHFGEHGLVDHAALLYDEAVDVPLLVRGPGVAPGRRSEPVQVVDVFPTALEHLGLPVPPGCQGRSLLRPFDREAVSEWYAAANGFLLQPQYRGRFDADLRSIRVGRWRLLEDERGRIELYDVEADPRELAEVSAANSGVVESLRGLLARWVEAHPPGETVKLERGPSSRGREEALRRTGYAGDEEAARPR
jgi:arylsulfatase A-like enzyme